MAIVPRLSKGTKDILDDKESIMLYLIAHSLQNPGFTSSLFENELVSLRSIMAKYGDNTDGIVNAYQSSMQRVINTYFPEDRFSVVVQKTVVDDITVSLNIDIKTVDGSFLSRNKITVVGDNISINYGAFNE